MSDKLKIAVFHNLPLGGALRILYDHILFLKSDGHQVDVYTPETSRTNFSPLENIADNYFEFPVKNGFFRSFIIKLINIFPLNFPISENSRFSVSFNQIKKVQREMANDINNKNYDIVFVEQDGLFSYSPAILQYLHKPTIYYCQQPMRNDEITDNLNFKANKTLSNPIFKKFFYYSKGKWMAKDKYYAQYSKYTLANSFFSHENILKMHGKNSQVSYLGVDIDNFKPKNLDRENFVVSVGAIIPDKGHDFAIKALGKVNPDIRPELYIIGYESTKTWREYLENLAKEENVTLKIFQNVTNEELSELYNKSKLSLFSQYLNPFGLVFLESMACGTPVIAVKEGGVREVIKHNENSILVPRDEDLFAKAITELLTNQDLWNKLSKNAIKTVNNHWTTKHAGKRLLDYMYEVIEKENLEYKDNNLH